MTTFILTYTGTHPGEVITQRFATMSAACERMAELEHQVESGIRPALKTGKDTNCVCTFKEETI